MKVTIVGAGNVGASCAEYILIKQIAKEVILLDIKDGFAEGKALDLTQTTSTLGFKSKVLGVTNEYEKTSSSDVVVITSGIPRKPGMTREELIGINAGIVKSVSENLLEFSPNAIIIVVSNPMDTMTYLVNKSFNIPKNRIIGMGGILDSSRFKTYISKYSGYPQDQIEAMVIGGHGDTTTKIASGENLRTFSDTDLTIPALIPISSSLVIPGFLGIPEVITTTSLLDVFSYSFVTPNTLDLKPSVLVV
jgi:malate dehydrogenase